MGAVQAVALRPILLSTVESVLLGLMAGGCRLMFAAPTAFASAPEPLRYSQRRLERLGGHLITVHSERAATLMATGASLSGQPAAALVSDGRRAIDALTGLDDLPPVVVDVSGRLPLNAGARLLLAPPSPSLAYAAGATIVGQAQAFRCPALIAGLEGATEWVTPTLSTTDPEVGAPPPIHHDGPDDSEILIVGAGPGFEACASAQQRLLAEGVAAAHLHITRVSPFPGAIIAPALTSSRRVLIVESGGPGTLATLIRSQLGAPVHPFGELPRLAGSPLGVAEIAWRAREVVAL